MASNGNDNDINFDAMLHQHIKNSGAANVAVCDRFDPDTANAYLERAMSQTALSAYETHLADCTICRRHIVELARLMPQVETTTVEAHAPDNFTVKTLAGWRQWFSGWRLGAIAGLGVATAALILFFANVQFSPKQDAVAVANKTTETSTPLPIESSQPFKDQIPAQPAPSKAETAQPRLGASPADVAKLTEMAAKKSAESNFKIDGTAAESIAAAPPPPAAAAAPGVVAAPKREEAANNLGQTQNQISATEWQRATPTPTPRGPAVNQMQVDRALVMKKTQAKEEKAESDKKDAPAAAGRIPEPTAVSADSVRDERAKEKEKRAEPVMEKAKPAAAKARAIALAKPADIPTRSVAGKEFRLVNGIWTDTNYNSSGNEPLIKVKFNSDEYKRILAAAPGLKPYFEMQSVIVVWQGKAYRVEK